MFGIKLIDSSYNHEVIELIKAFFKEANIDIVESYNKNYKYFIENIEIENKIYTRLFYKNNITERYFIKDNLEKKEIKNKIKKSVYELLSEISEINVPWGILTGIRPSKVVHEMMDKNFDEIKIKNILKNNYKMEDSKIKLIYDITKSERKYLYPLDKEKYSIYISIPFCPTTCLYCSFPSCNVKIYKDKINYYVNLLLKEIDTVSKYIDRDKISTVYIGGGTPTAISVRELDSIINKIYSIFSKDKIKEFTVEAGRPDTINDEYLKMFRDNKIDRISINPQTMNDKTLKIIGRNHKSIDIENIYYKAREIGNYKINMDIIVGLPSEGINEIKNSMEKIKIMNPDNLTVHTLSVKKGSRFKDTMDSYEVEEENIIENMLDITREYGDMMNMKPYYLYRQKQSMGNFENIGYSKKDTECIYNILMMEERETILAFGMGAVSKIFYPDTMKIKRVPNVKSLEEYINRNDEMIERKIKELEFLYG